MSGNRLIKRPFFGKADRLTIQMFRYAVIGGTAALSDWLLYWSLVRFGGIPYFWAAAISFTAATLLNYLLCIKWVFYDSRYSRWMEAGLVFLISLAGLGFNELILIILVEFISMHFLTAKVSATGVVFFWNFFARRRLFAPASIDKQDNI